MWVLELFDFISRVRVLHQPKNRKFGKWSFPPENSWAVVRDHSHARPAFIFNIIMWVVELFDFISRVRVLHQRKNRKFGKWSVPPENSWAVVRDHSRARPAFIFNIIMRVVELFDFISRVRVLHHPKN